MERCYSCQEVAELLNLSIESIRAYEGGKTQVPNDVVAEMCNMYGNERLAYLHLRLSPVGKIILPELKEQSSIAISVLMLVKGVNEILLCKDDLISIGADGIIDDEERKRFDEIIIQLEKFKTAIYALEFSVTQ